MLSVTGINRFYYLRGFTDMRCKHSRVLSVIREQLHREPSESLYRHVERPLYRVSSQKLAHN